MNLREQGAAAYWAGAPIGANPFKVGSMAWRQFRRGFNEAEFGVRATDPKKVLAAARALRDLMRENPGIDVRDVMLAAGVFNAFCEAIKE